MGDEVVEDLYRTLFEEERNVFLTGMGGTGKTYVINRLIELCLERGVKVTPTSTTGCSAINILYGRTLHSALGIGLARESAPVLARQILMNKQKKAAWLRRLLIIDECSMLSGELLDKLEEVARALVPVYRQERVFGGIRLLLVGDMLQLPPVTGDYIFTSSTWRDLNLKTVRLTVPQRFNDEKFFRLLARVRVGLQTERDVKKLKSRHQAYIDQKHLESDILPTTLFGRKVDVESYNMERLDALEGKTYGFTGKDSVFVRNVDVLEMERDQVKAESSTLTEVPGVLSSDEIIILDDLAPRRVILKVGAQVMLTRNLNLEQKLVNGSRGVVRDVVNGQVLVEFADGVQQLIEKVAFDKVVGKRRYVRSQIPLILAWALSIHKSQSATIDNIIVDLGSGIFAPGQAYVALSRVRNLKGLYLSNFQPKSLIVDEKAVSFDETIDK